jgi:hypothetical protein
LENLADLGRILRAETQLLAHALVPQLGQALGAFYAEAVEEEIVLVLVGFEKLGGDV